MTADDFELMVLALVTAGLAVPQVRFIAAGVWRFIRGAR